MDERPITTPGFDMERGEIFRLLHFYALNRILPLGYFAGMTRFRQLAVLIVTHHLGTLIFARLIPHEAFLTRVYARLRAKRREVSAPLSTKE